MYFLYMSVLRRFCRKRITVVSFRSKQREKLINKYKVMFPHEFRIHDFKPYQSNILNFTIKNELLIPGLSQIRPTGFVIQK